MATPDDLKYCETHEWARIEGNIATIGITDYAQDQLGDIVYVEFPEVDSEFEKGDDVANIESAKAVSEIKAPVSGKVIEINGAIEDEPELVNSSPYEKGWLFKIELSNPSEADGLLDAKAYDSLPKE